MSRPLHKRLWYDSLRVMCRIASVCVFRIRCYGREQVPREGGVLVVANHQSHLDPILIGLAIDRRLNFLARQSLFRFAPFAWLLRSCDTIPLDRDGSGLGGLKETLRRLKREEMVLIFPEGTRTRDGAVGTIKPGFIPLARRSGVPLLPVGLDGAYQAWPRTRRFPRTGRVALCIGRPILPEEMAALDDAQLLELVRERIGQAFLAAQRHRLGALGQAKLLAAK